jgi:uncharacterized protein (TIGR00369 family)
MTDSNPTLSTDAAELMKERGLGELAERMGIELLELSAEHSVATMPVAGNRQPLGLLHGGAFVVLAETLGSFSANVWGQSIGKFAVGLDVNASHSKSARDGIVKATCVAISLGKTVTMHEIKIENEAGERLSTVRITNLLRDRR